jgi:3-oxoacyl-[acyl-carrier protein] reductase
VDFGIRAKTAVVTASSGGMGRNIALALAAEGANIVLFARSADKLKAVADEIESLHGRNGVQAVPVAGSLLVREDLDRLAATLKSRFGGPDILVLNTGRPPNPLRATLDETDEERWHEAYRVQLWSVIQTANTLLPLMMGRGWGRIVAITSASAKAPMPAHALSTVFRAGVAAYMKHLANEVAAHGITVNCAAPALIENPHRLGTNAYTAEAKRERLKLSPIGREGTQEEFVSVVTFLASRQAGYLNGQTIQVEGGMTSSTF